MFRSIIKLTNFSRPSKLFEMWDNLSRISQTISLIITTFQVQLFMMEVLMTNFLVTQNKLFELLARYIHIGNAKWASHVVSRVLTTTLFP